MTAMRSNIATATASFPRRIYRLLEAHLAEFRSRADNETVASLDPQPCARYTLKHDGAGLAYPASGCQVCQSRDVAVWCDTEA